MQQNVPAHVARHKISVANRSPVQLDFKPTPVGGGLEMRFTCKPIIMRTRNQDVVGKSPFSSKLSKYSHLAVRVCHSSSTHRMKYVLAYCFCLGATATPDSVSLKLQELLRSFFQHPASIPCSHNLFPVPSPLVCLSSKRSS